MFGYFQGGKAGQEGLVHVPTSFEFVVVVMPLERSGKPSASGGFKSGEDCQSQPTHTGSPFTHPQSHRDGVSVAVFSVSGAQHSLITFCHAMN